MQRHSKMQKGLIYLYVTLGLFALASCFGGDSRGDCSDIELDSPSFQVTWHREPWAGDEDYTTQLMMFPLILMPEQSAVRHFKYSLFSTAQASCPPPYLTEAIDWVDVRSDADFDDNHMAGHSLGAMIFFDGQPIVEYFQDKDLWLMPHSRVVLSIPTQPSLDRVHNFTLEVMLDSGRYLELTISDVDFP